MIYGHFLRHKSLLRDTMEGIMLLLGKAARGRKRLEMLSNVTSKIYEDLKREAGDRSGWLKRDCHKPAIQTKDPKIGKRLLPILCTQDR